MDGEGYLVAPQPGHADRVIRVTVVRGTLRWGGWRLLRGTARI